MCENKSREFRSASSRKKAEVIERMDKHRTRTVKARNFARHLRKRATDSEKRLWRLLRDRRFANFKFRRQYPCGGYFLDFYCTRARLTVELDGGGHGFPDKRVGDEERNRFLVGKGIKVLRFWNHQLRKQCEVVRFEIWRALMEQTGRVEELAGFVSKPAPSPCPSPPMGARVTVKGGDENGFAPLASNSLRARITVKSENAHISPASSSDLKKTRARTTAIRGS